MWKQLALCSSQFSKHVNFMSLHAAWNAYLLGQGGENQREGKAPVFASTACPAIALPRAMRTLPLQVGLLPWARAWVFCWLELAHWVDMSYPALFKTQPGGVKWCQLLPLRSTCVPILFPMMINSSHRGNCNLMQGVVIETPDSHWVQGDLVLGVAWALN